VSGVLQSATRWGKGGVLCVLCFTVLWCCVWCAEVCHNKGEVKLVCCVCGVWCSMVCHHKGKELCVLCVSSVLWICVVVCDVSRWATTR
jgi:hypothetical protein